MNVSSDYDFLFKILLIGNSAVGKTNLLFRFTENLFNSGAQFSTIGVEFKLHTLQIGGSIVKVQVWDPAGQEKFKTIVNSFYRGTHGVVLVFDVTNRESFEDIDKWLVDIEKYIPKKVDMILCGNKSDLSNREVSIEEAQKYANQLGIKYFETSAKDAINVEEAFVSLVTQIKEKMQVINQEDKDEPIARRLTKAQAVEQKQKPSCC